MHRTTLAAIVVCIVGASAFVALAVGPTTLMNLANPNRPAGPEAGSGPRPNSFDAPTWHTGDTWTYDANASAGGVRADGPSATGSVTRTVVSADASQYNLSLSGTLHIRWMVDPTPMASGSDAYAASMAAGMLQEASLSGYTSFRASDLAIIKEVRTLEVHGSAATTAGTYNASYVATIMTDFDPALDVWSFPLQANETWNVTGNATVHGWIKWDLSGPNATYGAGVNFSYTVPVRLFLNSGATEDVSTPAGTFPAIPVSMGRPEILSGRPGIVSAPSDPAIGFDHEMPVEPLHSAQTWYSGTVKNVVKFHLFTAGMRLNLVLSSYHIA